MGSISQSLPQIAGTAISAGGAIGASAIAGSSLAVPVIGAAVAGVSLVIGMWLNSIAKHNAEKTATTQIVNQAELYLKQNLAAFQSLQQPTVSEQAQALANFNGIWEQVVKACESGQYEQAGQNCVNDRNRGGKWDWFSYYYDPIANAQVVPDSVGSSDPTTPGTSALGIPTPILILALGAVAFLLFDGGKN